MTIRAATDTDIPAIVELLRVSLGETLMPKSEAFWRWKHVNNPFGVSPVLVAEQDNRLVGVRAFMRWEWRQGDRVYRAVRAVDTATHPDYHGKGIFKTLTLQLVDQCREEGVDFIYNTPNAISKPGYLKMGWEEAGRLKVHVRPRVAVTRKWAAFESRFALLPADLEQVCELTRANAPVPGDDDLVTNRSLPFLTWRYAENPNVRYFMACNASHTVGFIFRLKAASLGTEFRICETFLSSDVKSPAFRDLLFATVRASGASLITYSGITLPFVSAAWRVGPVVTIRPLKNMEGRLATCWRPTLGDMEVF
jgi:N-acetylglutamate synthase-like GNAT family acetyltransferase